MKSFSAEERLCGKKRPRETPSEFSTKKHAETPESDVSSDEMVNVPEGSGGTDPSRLRDFFLVHSDGTPVIDIRGEWKTYRSAKPAGAACKVFYIFLRNEVGRGHIQRHLSETPREEESPDLTLSVEQTLQNYLEKKLITKEQAEAYREECRKYDNRIETFMLNVCICKRRSSAVRRYVVRYCRVKKPNVHEIKRKILKYAKATYVPRNKNVDPRARDIDDAAIL
jgi:hypothetical protein